MKHFSPFVLFVICLLLACDPASQEPERNYQIEVVSSAQGDIPMGAPVEVVLGFKEFTAKVQQLSFDFSVGSVAVTVDGATAVPNQRVSVALEGTSLVKFHATGLKAGAHKITVRAENGEASATCVVSLSISDRVYRVELLNNPIPALTVGKKEDIYLKVVDMQDPNHLFYKTPGYKVTARSLHDTTAAIIVGVTEVWNNTTPTPIVTFVPLDWAANEGTMLYNGLSIGTHQVEFTVTAPDGATSRTVHTLQVDSSKVGLKPRQEPKKVLSVTERHEATFDVDYMGHPANKVALMWEALPVGDPFGVAPDVTIDFVRPKAGVWTEFKPAREIGATTYPLPPAKAGSKQGFRLHVKDMYGWSQSFDYRFEVTSSEFTVSLVKSDKLYVQNMLNSATLRIENYPANSTFRYKLVPAESGYLSVVFNEKEYDTWYDVNLAGGKGEPYETALFFAYGRYYWAPASFRVVVQDKYEVEHTATFLHNYERNEVDFKMSQDYITATVGTPVTWTSTLTITKTDQHSYNNVTWTSPGLDLQAGTLKVNNIPLTMPAGGSVPQAVVSGDSRVVQISYTPIKSGVQEISITPVTWCADGSSTKAVRINAVPNAGSFAITPDRTTYEIPYAEARVYQDINVTLASANESAGLYDWDNTYKVGTSVYYSSNNAGRLVALDASGQEVAIAAKTTVPLKYAVGNVLRLRHYPAAVNDGSIERITLTVTRCDGATATSTVTVDAEDKGFEITEDQARWSSTLPIVTIPIRVVNRSKYYRGSYTLKSYTLTKNYQPTASVLRRSLDQVCTNIPLNGIMSAYVELYASEAGGGFSIRELIIQDDFGRGVTYGHGGFSFTVIDR